VAGVEVAPSFGYRCRVCGGPRIIVDDPAMARSFREVPWLVRARTLRRSAVLFRIFGAVVGALSSVGLIITLLMLALAQAATLAWLIALAVIVLPPFVLWLVLWRRAGAAQRELGAAMDQARLLVADDILRSRGELSTRELAQLMRASESQSEEILARLNLEDSVSSRVTAEGDLVYSTRAPGRMRILDDTGGEDVASEEADADAERAAARTSGSGTGSTA
jgi:hypothetical protein